MRYSLLILLAALSGCGPLFVPMLPRLDAEQQGQVDQIWDNLLTPVGRADRQTLLDANITFWMFTLGVDRLRMTSEKHFKGGWAVMEIDCDRVNPDADDYTITVFDDRGQTLRRERYTRCEVEESSTMMRGMMNFGSNERGATKVEAQVNIGIATTEPGTLRSQPATNRATTHPTTQPGSPESKKFLEESRRRQEAAIAATRPARVGR